MTHFTFRNRYFGLKNAKKIRPPKAAGIFSDVIGKLKQNILLKTKKNGNTTILKPPEISQNPEIVVFKLFLARNVSKLPHFEYAGGYWEGGLIEEESETKSLVSRSSKRVLITAVPRVSI